MAVDKLVDSAQLNADLTSVANAIRTKGDTTSALAFPAGFVSAINNLPTGSVTLTNGSAGGTKSQILYINNVSKIPNHLFAIASGNDSTSTDNSVVAAIINGSTVQGWYISNVPYGFNLTSLSARLSGTTLQLRISAQIRYFSTYNFKVVYWD